MSVSPPNIITELCDHSRELLPPRPLVHTRACCMIPFAQPSVTAPPAGPPRTWSGNGNGAYAPPPPPPNSGGQAYGAPPSFAPPMGPPSSGNGIGPPSMGGQGVYGGRESMPHTASTTPLALNGGGGGRGLAPPMGAPGQVREAFLAKGCGISSRAWGSVLFCVRVRVRSDWSSVARCDRDSVA